MDPQSSILGADDSSEGAAVLIDENKIEEEFVQNTSSDIMDCDGTDFAAQLRKRRKQVLEKDDAATKNGFSDALRKHREHLVDTWDDNHPNHSRDEANLNINTNTNEEVNTDDNEVENNDEIQIDAAFHVYAGTDVNADADADTDTDTDNNMAQTLSKVETPLSDDTNPGNPLSDDTNPENLSSQSFDQTIEKKIKDVSSILLNDDNDEDEDDNDDNGNSQVVDQSLQQNAESEINGEIVDEKGLDSMIEDKGFDSFDQIVSQSEPDMDIDKKQNPTDFTSQISVNDTPSLSDNDDNFGEFSDTSAQKIQSEQPVGTNESKKDDDDNDNDNKEALGKTGPSLQIEHQNSLPDTGSDDDDDDWGDFDQAPTMEPQAHVVDYPISIDKNSEINNDSNVNCGKLLDTSEQINDVKENDEIIDRASSSLESEQHENHFPDTGSDDDDDWGDFDQASVDKNSEIDNNRNDNVDKFLESAPKLQSEQINDVKENDEIIDRASPSLQSEKHENHFPDAGSDDDDDWGDFDQAPTTESQAPVENNGEDDSNIKYLGKIAPRLQSEQLQKICPDAVSNDADFGDFGGVSGSLTLLAPGDRIDDKTRNIFAKMQALYSFLDTNDEKRVVCSELLSEVSIEKFLASSKTTQEVEEDGLEHDRLDRYLKGTKSRKENSNLIINDDGRGPFHCFKYPLTGLRAPHTAFENERQRRKSLIRACVPDVLPIQLPTGKEMPLEIASPITGCLTNISTSTSVEITPLPDPSVSEDTDRSSDKKLFENVQKLKSKIPDLSFMLESKLKLPNN